MRSVRAVFSIVAGLLVSVLLAEVALRALPVTMGLYRTQNHAAWPLHAYGPHQHFSYSMTWQMLHPNRGTTNNYGQIAPFDYTPDSNPVVVIGDSFIEALMNRSEDTLQGELGKMFYPNTPVYGLGFSGNSLAEYLAIARMARSEFAPIAMIFLVIDNDIKESWSNRTGHRYFQIHQNNILESYIPLNTVSLPQLIRQVVGDSALYRYIQGNLGFSLEGMIERRTKSQQISSHSPSNEFEQLSRIAAEYFLTNLPVAAGLPADRLIFVFDSDRERIYDSSRAPRRGVDSPETQQYFKELAQKLGFKIVEMGPLFAEHFQLNHRKFDYTPTDRHWNGLAHRLAASAVCRSLAQTTKRSDSDQLSVNSKPAIKCSGTSTLN